MSSNTRRHNRHKPKSRKLGKGRMNKSNGPFNLTTIKTNPVHTRVIRYIAPGNGASLTFTVTDMLSLMGFADTISTGFSMISAFKLNKIKISVLPDSTDVTGSFVFTWLGQFSPNSEVSVMYMNAVPATLTVIPFEGSVASWWLTDTTTSQDLFAVEMSTTVPYFLDLHFSYCMPQDNTATTALTFAAPTVTAGRFIYPSIPRASAAASRIDPVGLPTD